MVDLSWFDLDFDFNLLVKIWYRSFYYRDKNAFNLDLSLIWIYWYNDYNWWII
jgi:hypothetical protein